jgi:hypothetical protein
MYTKDMFVTNNDVDNRAVVKAVAAVALDRVFLNDTNDTNDTIGNAPGKIPLLALGR